MVSAVAPCVPRDGDRAVGVNVEPRSREGSLSRATVVISVVCPRHDDARFEEMTEAAARRDRTTVQKQQ